MTWSNYADGASADQYEEYAYPPEGWTRFSESLSDEFCIDNIDGTVMDAYLSQEGKVVVELQDIIDWIELELGVGVAPEDNLYDLWEESLKNY